MPQVKKQAVEDAIVQSARALFSRRGFVSSTMAEIARRADTPVANLYSYFPSKLHILYAVYRPWLEQQLRSLRKSLQSQRSPRARVRHIVLTIWGEIPAADHCFANCLIEALAVAPEKTGKPNDLLRWCEKFVEELFVESLPEHRRYFASRLPLSHVVWMAFDGFVINRRLGDVRDLDAVADLFADLLLGAEPAQIRSLNSHTRARRRIDTGQQLRKIK